MRNGVRIADLTFISVMRGLCLHTWFDWSFKIRHKMACQPGLWPGYGPLGRFSHHFVPDLKRQSLGHVPSIVSRRVYSGHDLYFARLAFTPEQLAAMPLSSRRTPLVGAIALTCLIALVLVSLHPSTTSYAQFPRPIHDYFSPPPLPLATCPSVHDRGRPPLVHETQTCYPVPSNHSSFALEVCYTPDTCNEFTARIGRTNQLECMEAEDTPDPSEDAGLTRWMREERGPDAFYLRTDGAERYASVYPTYEGKCAYSFDVRLKNPGDTYLQIWWTEEVRSSSFSVEFYFECKS